MGSREASTVSVDSSSVVNTAQHKVTAYCQKFSPRSFLRFLSTLLLMLFHFILPTLQWYCLFIRYNFIVLNTNRFLELANRLPTHITEISYSDLDRIHFLEQALLVRLRLVLLHVSLVE